ncbi:hypothetical protein [Streptomyces sp. NPDC002758]
MGNSLSTVVKPSVEHVMDAPLEQLVEELHITLDVSSITDPTFTGYVIASRDRVVVSMPAGRTELEHDCIARYLIASAFDVDGLPPLPEPFEVTELTETAGGAA